MEAEMEMEIRIQQFGRDGWELRVDERRLGYMKCADGWTREQVREVEEILERMEASLAAEYDRGYRDGEQDSRGEGDD